MDEFFFVGNRMYIEQSSGFAHDSESRDSGSIPVIGNDFYLQPIIIMVFYMVMKCDMYCDMYKVQMPQLER